jgi:hypothetical protein
MPHVWGTRLCWPAVNACWPSRAQEAGRPAINIICEKLTYVGSTRFEDDSRLPLGSAVNSASYAAKALTQAGARCAEPQPRRCLPSSAARSPPLPAVQGSSARLPAALLRLTRPAACPPLRQVAAEPRFLAAYMSLGRESDLVVQDASAFAAEGEQLSFLQLQARAASVRQVSGTWAPRCAPQVPAAAPPGPPLSKRAPSNGWCVQVVMGWYRIPATAAQPIEMVVNPQGLEERGLVGALWGDAA